VNRADGISEIEGKVARVAASEQGRERVSNSCLKSVSEKNFSSDEQFGRSFSFMPTEGKDETKSKERKNMNSLTQFKKILILPLLIVLALVVGALTAVPAFATPPVGVTPEVFATGPFDELGTFGEGYLRFSVANSIENIEKALDRVAAWVDKNL
jgi:hypothetical protein